MVQKVVGSIPISHPTGFYVKSDMSWEPELAQTVRSRYPTPFAGIVQRLVCEFSKLEMRFRLPLPAPSVKFSLIWAVFCCFCGDGECSWCCGGDSS